MACHALVGMSRRKYTVSIEATITTRGKKKEKGPPGFGQIEIDATVAPIVSINTAGLLLKQNSWLSAVLEAISIY